MELIPNLFNKFERLEEDKNTSLEGTGLGLSITKRLVELMHGTIEVESVYGKGSKFTISINQKISKSIQHREKEEKISNNTDFKNAKVLIVDDNKINLKVASKLLSNYGITSTNVESGFDCLDKISQGEEFDLILLDDMMPKMSGLEVLEKMRAQNIVTPVLLLTAKAELEDRVEGLNLGADDYLAKPFAMAELLARVNALVRRGGEYSMQTFSVGNTVLKTDGMELSVGSHSLRLAGKEVEMLSMLMRNPGRTILVSQFIEHLSNEGEVTLEMIRLYISYLENKLDSLQADVFIEGTMETGFKLSEKGDG